MNKSMSGPAIGFMVLFLLLLVGACPSKEEGMGKLTVTGKVLYVERIDGFMIRGEDPPEEFMIDNPNTAILKDLADKGATVIAEGYMKGGADIIFIEKIDGKSYVSQE